MDDLTAPVTDQELIRIRNAGKITWDKMVSHIITELLERRAYDRRGPCWCPYCGEPHGVARRTESPKPGAQP